ncbi:MAG: hypothetical protein JNM86_03190 [Phycisphaerae bacterium]|nr:hypothetical protein [Phycisphaerae bacterium]
MNRAIRKLLVTAAMCAAPVFFTNALAASPQGTSFTYQGRLTDSGAPANGSFDIELRLFDASVAGVQVGSTITLNDQSVANGVFTASLDFGAQFNGSARWLELRVRPGASVGAYTTILPRTLLDSTPYAQALRLPVAETGTTSSAMLSFTNLSTTGSVMSLTSAGPSGNYPGGFFQPVLSADTDDGNGIFALTSANGAYALYAVQSGTGGRAIVGRNTSTSGRVSTLDITDATNDSTALEVKTIGLGMAATFTSTNAASQVPTVRAITEGSGDTIPSGTQENGVAIKGEGSGTRSIGVMGVGPMAGVFGSASTGGAGVYGRTTGGFTQNGVTAGVRGDGNGSGTAAVAAFNNLGTAIYGQSSGTNSAGFFSGNVTVTGDLQVNGSKNFKIDHPLDPANKFLVHAAVESSEMKNIYDGVVTLGADGSATVTMPNYFGALNVDYRYQLTCIGGQAMVYIAEEMSQNHFKIAGGKPGMKVSWQVTGVRNDATAISRPMKTEVDKVGYEIGRYMNPEAFGQPATMKIDPMDEPKASKSVN